VAALDYVSPLALSIAPWVPGPYTVLGADGFGRSEDRQRLRRFFEVDAENIALAALYQLTKEGEYSGANLAAALRELDLDSEKMNPATSGED
jgi:pyruvate dehydrogenase E1 component